MFLFLCRTENETKETNQTTGIQTLRNLQSLRTTRRPEKLRLLLLHHAGMDDAGSHDPEMLCFVEDECPAFV
jgi:hypothetical protein